MTEKQIEQLLKDYHWMINSVKIMREGLNDVGGNFTAQYGLEAAMPKAAGGHSDPIYQEFSRREKRWKKISDYEQKIKMVQDKIHLITVDREIEVLHWLLEGMSMRWIGRHMGLSHTNIQRIQETIIRKMVNVPEVPNVPDVP
ncbi:DNA-binding response regulator [Sporosarcina sp. resist]|uniref:helix-turn-helix transcriptional regulator n=1 Tax=Sporosarcina sp. resist TaxID=2762563 RepID=UPI00164CFC50|nr:LuxR C-terminal-related transcriptional regulator [Sporosarcina sp. resist]QNK89423.1 DNA-binding response regulator [Sporosarcina sp. resist]